VRYLVKPSLERKEVRDERIIEALENICNVPELEGSAYAKRGKRHNRAGREK